MNWFKHARIRSGRVDVSRCAKPDAAADCCSEVGQDVAEKVVGDDYVEALGVGCHKDHGGIDVLVVDLHAREFFCNSIDSALP